MDNRWSNLNRLLSTPTPFPNESGRLPIGEFIPSSTILSHLQSPETQVLVIGAGGLGCEVCNVIYYK